MNAIAKTNQNLAESIVDNFLTERKLEKNNLDANQNAFNSIIAVILSNPVARHSFICLILNRDFCLASIVSTLHADSQVNTIDAYLFENKHYQDTGMVDEALYQALSHSRLMTRLINKASDSVS